MSEKQLTILLFVILGAQILLGGAGIWYYQFVSIPDLEAQLAQAQATQADFQKKANAVKGLETAIAKVKKEIDELTLRIPKFGPGENDDFADLVDKIRKRSRVNITGLRYKAPTLAQAGQPALAPGLFKAQYEVGIKGSFYHLLNFIFHIESEHRFLTVADLSVTAGISEGQKIPSRDLVVTLTTFMSRDPNPAQPAAGPQAGAGTPAPSPTPEPTPSPEPEKKTSTPPPD